jgi:3-oxoacyl-[acyl-carrier protein] reductase
VRTLALITGAGRGIGRAVALRLGADGFAVCVHYHTSERLAAEAVAEIQSAGGDAFSCGADLRDPAAVDALFEAVEARPEPLGVLVNNAGITRDGPVARMSEERWADVLATDLTGPWRCIARAARRMRKTGGSIVNIGSSGALVGNPGQANYAAAKAGLLGMTRSLARELGPRSIRVNAVVPGFTRTDMTADLPREHMERIRSETPLGRLSRPEDVAAAVAFFAGADAAMITGQVLVVDGGRA